MLSFVFPFDPCPPSHRFHHHPQEFHIIAPQDPKGQSPVSLPSAPTSKPRPLQNNRSRHSNGFPFHGGSSITHPFRHRPDPDALFYHCFGSAAGFSAFADDTTRTTVAASAFR